MFKFQYIFLLFIIACSGNPTTESNNESESASTEVIPNAKVIDNKEPLVFTTNIDNLRLRDQPGTEGKELVRLPLGTKVFDTGEISEFTTPLKLRGISFDEPWIKVTTEQGVSGWIYGGALNYALNPKNPEAEVLLQKRLNGFFGQDIAGAIQKYRQNYNNTNTAAQFAIVYEEGLALRKRLVDRLEEKIEVDYEELPDLFWLKEAMPGYVPELVAEGTMYHLFNDYKQFQQKAKHTNGSEDDEMAGLFFLIYQLDSVEHFYPAYFMQTWDYGGNSLLGKGIHTKVLDKMDSLVKQNSPFDKTITDLKNELVLDITNQEVTGYWESEEAVIRELKTIIKKNYFVFTKEDNVALEARLKMIMNAKANKIEFNKRAGG
jgi:hypothetical protein